MRDYVNVGSSPANEPCAQLGTDDYSRVARAECKRFIEVIRAALGPEPDGARLYVKGNAHDFGTYYEVVCEYDEEKPESVDYAYRCESDAPADWPE